MEENKYEKYKNIAKGVSIRNSDPTFNENLDKFAKVYEDCDHKLSKAILVFQSMYPQMSKKYVHSLSRRLIEVLGEEGNLAELKKVLGEKYRMYLDIAEEQMFETGDIEKPLKVLKEYQETLGMRKKDTINVNSNNTVNNTQNNLVVDHKTRMSDLPEHVQKALKEIGRYKENGLPIPTSKALEEEKTKVDDKTLEVVPEVLEMED